MKKVIIFFILFFAFFIWLFAQKYNYDYAIMIKVEGKSLEEGVRIKQELYDYAEKNKLAIEQYSKKEFEQLQYEKSIKKIK